eukprot:3446062-Pyramimonas_sp.AAC.1
MQRRKQAGAAGGEEQEEAEVSGLFVSTPEFRNLKSGPQVPGIIGTYFAFPHSPPCHPFPQRTPHLTHSSTPS